MNTRNYLAIIAVMTLTLAGCASTHGTSPKGLEVPIEKAALKFSSDIKDGGYKVVGTDELKKWLDKDNLIKAVGHDKEQPVVIYCGFVACRRSHIGAKVLVENGFKNVYRYPAGITGWQESGYPLTK
jgi:thiosulfate/3-mercaptopyruvate sulfurtransferase